MFMTTPMVTPADVPTTLGMMIFLAEVLVVAAILAKNYPRRQF